MYNIHETNKPVHTIQPEAVDQCREVVKEAIKNLVTCFVLSDGQLREINTTLEAGGEQLRIKIEIIPVTVKEVRE